MSRKIIKNVIMVVLDTHRYDRLGSYGYERPTTPNLDSFASESLLFEQAIAPGQWTIPSHASLFSGEAPAVHRTLQADDALPKEYKTLAGRLSDSGVRTTGFCNNPLVGIIQNGLKRGFDQFYNYCGVVPSTPQNETDDLWKPIRILWSKYTQILRRLSYPIQNTFASPNEFFLGALKPLFVPMWTRAANFKGMTGRSINDTTHFMKKMNQDDHGGNFVFLNLMETHMPYTPPDTFIEQFAPYFFETPEAQQFLRDFNRRAMQWLIPLAKPLTDLESMTLSDLYDAEVAYQDYLLAELIEELNTPYHRDHTMVVFLADHGEMLGEHGYMGHGFGVYEPLVRVPLFIRYPGLTQPKRIGRRVSITQLFYTVLDYFGFESISMPYAEAVDVGCQSLLNAKGREACSQNPVIAEAYAPENALRIMMRHTPGLKEQYHAENTRRAVYQRDDKLIAVEGLSNRLYNLAGDPDEAKPYQDIPRINTLVQELEVYLDLAASRRKGTSNYKISLKDDLIQQRLRDLGYIE
jgi:arylsulfatase A-like enzyme